MRAQQLPEICRVVSVLSISLELEYPADVRVLLRTFHVSNPGLDIPESDEQRS